MTIQRCRKIVHYKDVLVCVGMDNVKVKISLYEYANSAIVAPRRVRLVPGWVTVF